MNQDATWYGGKPRPKRRCVRWGRSSPLKGAQPSVFSSCLLWPNGWMDEDATWYSGRPQPRPHSVRWVPSSLPKVAQPPVFGPCLLWPRSPSQLLLSSCNRTLTCDRHRHRSIAYMIYRTKKSSRVKKLNNSPCGKWWMKLETEIGSIFYRCANSGFG